MSINKEKDYICELIDLSYSAILEMYGSNNVDQLKNDKVLLTHIKVFINLVKLKMTLQEQLFDEHDIDFNELFSNLKDYHEKN